MGTISAEEIVDYFTLKGLEELIYDTTGAKDHEIFESLRCYIERVQHFIILEWKTKQLFSFWGRVNGEAQKLHRRWEQEKIAKRAWIPAVSVDIA